MSGRIVPRFALAGLLAAAVAASAVAQEGGQKPSATEFAVPEHIQKAPAAAPMPHAKEQHHFEVELSFGIPGGIELNWKSTEAPAKPHETSLPSQCADNRPQSAEPMALRRPASCCDGPKCCGNGTAAQPVQQGCVTGVAGNCCGMPACGMSSAGPIIVVRGAAGAMPARLASACPFQAAASPLLGTWYRSVGGWVSVVTFTPDEMKLRLTAIENDKQFILTVTAHYALTKDGLVHGAVTSADIEVDQGEESKNLLDDDNLAELMAELQGYADAPFSFRVKETSAGLMVSALKVAPPQEVKDVEDLLLLGGLYKRSKDGRVPTVATRKAGQGDLGSGVGVAVGAAAGALLGNCADRDACPRARIGVDFSTNPPTFSGITLAPALSVPMMSQPVPPYSDGPPTCTPACPMTQPVLPATGCVPNEAMKRMAIDAFIQMLPKEDVKRVGGMTLPSPRYLQHFPQYFEPDPAFPQPRELAGQEGPLGGCKSGVLGTWYRELGAKRCVIAIAADHMTITISEAYEEGGDVVTGHLTFTADYHLTRDGSTVVGLFANVDAKFEGDLCENEAIQMFDNLRALQTELEDKPFAMNLRMYGDKLVIGKVRMQSLQKELVDTQPATFLSGRFTRLGDKPLPKLKAMKMGEPRPLPANVPPPPLAYPAPPGAMPMPYAVPLPANGFLPPPPPGFMPPPGAYPYYGPAPTPANELLPPQSVPSAPAPRPGGCPTEKCPAQPLPEIKAVPCEPVTPVSEVVPTMTAPAAPVLPMAPPIQPGEPTPVRPTELEVGWNSRIEYLPDPTRNGAMVPGLLGQMYLYGGPKLQFVDANGTLTVDLVDVTPRPAGQKCAAAERWLFTKETLNRLSASDETFGRCYKLFLPWSGYTHNVTHVRLSARFDVEDGGTLWLTPEVLNLKHPARGTIPALGPVGLLTDYTVPTAKGPYDHKQRFQFSEGIFSGHSATSPELAPAQPGVPMAENPPSQPEDDPNALMERLLRESEDLQGILKEFRRFFFNEEPFHLPPYLTPERVHGGVY